MNDRSAIRRKTVARTAAAHGMGVTSARDITVRLIPHDGGIVFRRTDTGAETRLCPDTAGVGPSWSCVGSGDGQVRITEHLLACLAAAGITDVLVEVSGPELPLGDGSARQWWRLLTSAGVRQLDGAIEPLAPPEPVTVHDPAGGQTLCLFPADRWQLIYVLDWPHPLVGLQTARFTVGADDFGSELAAARTFTLEEDARRAKEAGLFPGGSEENLIIVYPDRLSADPGLPDAFARHKLVDLLGDLYLLARPLRALVVGYNSGHRLNHQMLQRLVRACAR